MLFSLCTLDIHDTLEVSKPTPARKRVHPVAHKPGSGTETLHSPGVDLPLEVFAVWQTLDKFAQKWPQVMCPLAKVVRVKDIISQCLVWVAMRKWPEELLDEIQDRVYTRHSL